MQGRKKKQGRLRPQDRKLSGERRFKIEGIHFGGLKVGIGK